MDTVPGLTLKYKASLNRLPGTQGMNYKGKKVYIIGPRVEAFPHTSNHRHYINGLLMQ